MDPNVIHLDIPINWRQYLQGIVDALQMAELVDRVMTNLALSYMNDYPHAPRCLGVWLGQHSIRFIFRRNEVSEEWIRHYSQEFTADFLRSFKDQLDLMIIRISCRQKNTKGAMVIDQRSILSESIIGRISGREMKQWFMTRFPSLQTIPNEDVGAVILTKEGKHKGKDVVFIDSVVIIINDEEAANDVRQAMADPKNVVEMKDGLKKIMMELQTIRPSQGGAKTPAQHAEQLIAGEQKQRQQAKAAAAPAKKTVKGGKKASSRRTIQKKQSVVGSPDASFTPHFTIQQGVFQNAPQGADLQHFADYVKHLDKSFPGIPIDVKKRLYVQHSGDMQLIVQQITKAGGSSHNPMASSNPMVAPPRKQPAAPSRGVSTSRPQITPPTRKSTFVPPIGEFGTHIIRSSRKQPAPYGGASTRRPQMILPTPASQWGLFPMGGNLILSSSGQTIPIHSSFRRQQKST